ncbi:MAG: cyclase [Anaerolineae bacterium SG8_19]|jgi:quinol monooxygenase YgiN|nr:MAG: cyclase [Anaerolineae bacterium SG8_19]
MATTFVKHPVNDYASWKRVYDNLAQYRKEHGVTGASVHRDPKDPNMIIVTHQFGSLSDAQAFVNSEDLKGAMQEAGVSGPPEIWVTEDVESTPY